MRLTPCLDCGGVVSNIRGGRCPECAAGWEAARDKRRGSSTDRGYGRAWEKAVAAAIAAQPWCSECGTPGSSDNPLTGDHIKPISKGGTDDPDNLDVLCRRHNSSKGNR